jgi:hypothetical protein
LTTKILALADALGNLVRFVLLPGHRYDTVGVAPLIQALEFRGLIADKAFDTDWIIGELNDRGAKIVISQRPNRRAPLAIARDLQMAASDRELLLSFEGVQTHRHAQRQDRPELRRHYSSRGCCDRIALSESQQALVLQLRIGCCI